MQRPHETAARMCRAKFLPLGRRLQSDDESCLARAHDSGHKQVRRARPYGRRLLQRLPDVRHDEPRKRWPRGDRGSRGGRLAPAREALLATELSSRRRAAGTRSDVLSARLDFKYSSDNLKTMASGAAKVALFDAFASVAQALGSGRRAEIVDVLAQGERRSRRSRTRSRRASRTPRSICRCWRGRASFAPAARGRGSSTGSASDRVGDLWAAVRDVAVRHVAEVNGAGRRVPGRPGRGRAALGRRSSSSGSARGDVVVLDVRPGAEYRAGHIAGRSFGAARRRSSAGATAAAAAGGRRLLPRPVLRLRRRRRAAAPRPRA